MPTYYGNFACGHEGKIYLAGKHKDTEWLANKKFESDLCPACYEIKEMEEREILNNEAAKAAQHCGFPDLAGSQKQVAWATTIRQSMYDDLQKDMQSFCTDPKNIVRTVRDILRNNTLNRGILKQLEKIMVQAPRNDVFKKTVTDLRYSWGGNYYYRVITKTMGSYYDRITELVTTLVNQGFTIFVDGEEIYKRAKVGNYEPEQLRWISYNNEEQCLAIWWRYRDQELYQRARKNRSSKYQNGEVLVPLKYRKMVKLFSEENDFSFTEKALEVIEQYETKEDNK